MGGDESGKPCAGRPGQADQVGIDSAMMVQEVTNDADLFGGYGLMRGHPVEKLLRDGLPNRVVEGSIEANQWTMANYDLDLI